MGWFPVFLVLVLTCPAFALASDTTAVEGMSGVAAEKVYQGYIDSFKGKSSGSGTGDSGGTGGGSGSTGSWRTSQEQVATDKRGDRTGVVVDPVSGKSYYRVAPNLLMDPQTGKTYPEGTPIPQEPSPHPKVPTAGGYLDPGTGKQYPSAGPGMMLDPETGQVYPVK